MPPCPTRNSNQEEDLVKEVETGSQITSIGLLGTRVGPVPPVTTPGMSYNALPNLAKAFSQLTNSLNNTRKPSVQAQVRQPDQFNGSDTCKLQPFLTQCLLNFRDRPNTFSNDSTKVAYVLSSMELRSTGSNPCLPLAIMHLGFLTTPHLSPNSGTILALMIWKEKLKRASRISKCAIPNGSQST